MENGLSGCGKWKVESGKWKVDSGKWRDSGSHTCYILETGFVDV